MKLFHVIAKVQVEVLVLVKAETSAEAQAQAMKLPLDTNGCNFTAWGYNWNYREAIQPLLASQIITVVELR